MKRFACGDVVPGCDASFVAPTEQRVLEQVAVHAQRDHGIDEVSPELADAVTAAIRAA